MKKFASLIVAAALSLLTLSSLPMAEADELFPTQLTAQGQRAVQQIGDCVNSRRDLQVYYLIDGSGSLKETDPDNLRAEVLATSLEQLAPKDDSLKVSYAVGTFGTSFRPCRARLPRPASSDSWPVSPAARPGRPGWGWW